MGKLGAFRSGVWILVLLVGCTPSFTPRPTPTVIAPRQIAGGTLALREYWRVRGSCGGGLNLPHLVATSMGRLLQLRWDFGRQGWQIRALESRSGKTLWETGYGPFISLTSDSERVYAQRGSEIQAYSLADGQLLWTRQVIPHILYNLHAEDKLLMAVGDGELYLWDVSIGEELEHTRLKTADGFPLLARLGEVDIYKTGHTLRAVDPAGGQLLWEVRIESASQIHSCPVLWGDTLLVADEGFVIAIDVNTGIVKWSNYGRLFVSNPTVANGFVYALDYTSRLVQLEIETGQEKGYLQFMPERHDSSGGCIASGEEMFFVSFDDSGELIALGP